MSKSAIIVGLSAILSTPALAADEAEIVVTASGIEQPRSEVGQAITIITEQELRQRQTQVVTDLLRTTPGVTYARNGGGGGTSSVFIRGGDSAHTLVLIDGVRINDPSSPSGAFDFGKLVTGNIARIEVLRGPNSVIWGSQAIGGIVNIETKEPAEALTASGRSEYGYRDTGEIVGNVAGRSGMFSGSIGAGYFRTDGISAFSEARGGQERDGYRNFGANGKLRVALGDAVSLDFRGYYSDSRNDFDNPPLDTLPETDTEQFVGYVGANVTLLDGRFRNRIAFTRTDIDRVTTDPDPASFNPAIAKGEAERFEYQGSFEVAPQLTLLFGAATERTHSETLFPTFETVPTRLKVSIDSYYGQAIVKPVEQLTIAGGMRHDDHGTFGGETTFGANFAFTPNAGGTVLRGTYAEGFRAPSLSEALSPFGNPDLRPERAKSYDIGFEQRLLDGAVAIEATWFQRRLRDQIVFSGDSFMLENVSSTRAKGVELGLRLKPVEGLDVVAQYSWIDTENRSTEPDFSGSVNFGNDLARRPEQTVSISADYRFPFGLAVGGTILHVGDSFDDFANQRPLDGYVLVDLRASYALNETVELYGRVENLLDEHYETVFRYGTIGRAAYGGVRFAF